MLTVQDLTAYRQAMKGLDSALLPQAEVENSTDNLGSGVSQARLEDETLEPAVYTLAFDTPSASGTTVYCSVDGSGTTLCNTGVWISDLINGVGIKISTSVAQDDMSVLEIQNDYARCRSWAEDEVARFLDASEADYTAWIHKRCVRSLFETVANSWAIGAFDSSRGGENLGFEGRLALLQQRIEAMDREWNQRRTNGPKGVSTDLEFEMIGAFDETMSDGSEVL